MVNLQRLCGVLIVSFPGRWRPSANHPAKPSQNVKSCRMVKNNVTCKLRYGTFTLCVFDVFNVYVFKQFTYIETFLHHVTLTL
jgi:hypothetical protein